MDSNMSTAAYVHRAGGASSASSTSNGSSPQGATAPPVPGMANGNGGAGGGSRMAVIGVTRNVKLRRRGAAGFGFSIRGGREYSAGFYVSDVVPGGEAHSHGLRVGDQILRVNGYPVEDAVHQEVALLAKNQQVLVLKIRSVGMIPVKDNPNDPVTWHMVHQQQQQLQYGDAVTNEIRIRVLLGEKGKLGCGVCRGLVPGLTVQGTREGGAARAAGLRAGDVITWCNGQTLTDLPFERAIEHMRNAAILDLIVQRPLTPNIRTSVSNEHVYDCPEALWMRGSSGYDSESSSLVGTSPSPPMNYHHLTASSPQRRSPGLPPNCNRNGRNCCPQNGSSPADWGHVEQEWTRKPNNTTVIRISQNHPQQQYGTHYRRGSTGNMGVRHPMRLYDCGEEPLYDPVAPRDFESHDFDANPRDELDRRAEYRREHGIREPSFEAQLDDVFVKENGQTDGGSVVLGVNGQQRQLTTSPGSEKDRKTVTTVEVHQQGPPAPPPPLPYKWPAETKPMNAMGMQMGSTMSMGSTGSTETESSLESSCGGKDCAASTTSSLSTSSSTCEQQVAPPSTTTFATSIAAACAAGAKMHEPGGNIGMATLGRPKTAAKVPPPPPPPPIDLGSALTQELQRRAKQRSMNNAATGQESTEQQKGAEARKQPQNPEALRAQEQKVTHDKLMEEFKRAHQRMFSNNQQRQQSTEQNAEQEIDKSNGVEEVAKPSQENGQVSTANNVENLATALGNKVTIRVNPEASNR